MTAQEDTEEKPDPFVDDEFTRQALRYNGKPRLPRSQDYAQPIPKKAIRRAQICLLVVVLAVVLAFVSMQNRIDELEATRPTTHDPAQSFVAPVKVNANFPTPRAAASRVPLGTPDVASIGYKPFAFMELQKDSMLPVTYDPCRQINIVVNKRTMPKDGDRMLTEAIERVSAISGLKLVIEGESDEAPADEREWFQSARYGDRWAPVLVAWSDPKELKGLDGDVAGRGGSTWVESPTGVHTYVSGRVMLDGPEMKNIVRDYGWANARAIVMHELSHLVGLAHTDSAGQIMSAEGSYATEFQSGDRSGLAQLGQGACVPLL